MNKAFTLVEFVITITICSFILFTFFAILGKFKERDEIRTANEQTRVYLVDPNNTNSYVIITNSNNDLSRKQK